MKLAVQLGLLPGDTIADKAQWAKDHGVQGIELHFKTAEGLHKEAEQINGVVPVCSVCGNGRVDGTRSFDFLDPDHNKRRESIEGAKAILGFCGDVGAVGQIVPPIFGGPVVPNLSPWKSPLEIEDELMLAACEELGPYAAEKKTLFMLEPLNRYEQHYLRTQADGVRIIKKVSANARKGVGLLSDFFHMHIEETSTPQAFNKCAKFTSHVHLADNTRLEPGTGDIDFVPALKELHNAGFKGYMAYECGLSGNTPKKRDECLAKSLDTMREHIQKATSKK